MFAWVRPLADSERVPFWRSLAEVLRPSILHFSHCGRVPDCTHFVNMVLNTTGPFFAEFEVHAMNTLNGAPSVGLVDASKLSQMQRESRKVRHDLSRDSQGSLAISFSP